MTLPMRYLVLMALVTAAAVGVVAADERQATTLKTESFDKDPGWEGHNNRVVPKTVKTVQQGFGFSATNYAGKEKGEIGGTIWRSATPAYYGAKIPDKTLNDKLTASGTFALTASAGSSGVFFGWFSSDAGRESCLGFHLAGQGAGARLTLRLVTGTNHACGTKVTPWEVDKTKPAGRPAEISAAVHPQRRHALHLDAQLRPKGRRRQRSDGVHDPQQQQAAPGI